MAKCPICRNEQSDSDSICSICGFPQMNRVFLNSAEVERWLKDTVEPCQAIWRNCNAKYKPIGDKRLAYRQCPKDIGELGAVDRPGIVYAITDSNGEQLSPIQIEGRMVYNTSHSVTANVFCHLDNLEDNLRNAVDYFYSIAGVGKELMPTQPHLALEYRIIGENTAQEFPCLASVIALYSLFRNASFMNNAMLVGEMTINGKAKPCNRIQEILELCADYQIRNIILPITSAYKLADVSVELLGIFRLFFYYDAKDAIRTVLQLSEGDFSITV